MIFDAGEIRGLGRTSVRTGLMLAATGWAVWTGLSIWAGMTDQQPGLGLRDAWDLDAYLYLGIPIMAIAVAAAAFHSPERAWRWPLWLVAGHQFGMLLVGLGMQSALSLFILTLILAVMLAAAFALPALIGSQLARRVAGRSYS